MTDVENVSQTGPPGMKRGGPVGDVLSPQPSRVGGNPLAVTLAESAPAQRLACSVPRARTRL